MTTERQGTMSFDELDGLKTLIKSLNPCEFDGDDSQVFATGVCIGDSLTAGTFNYLEGGDTTNYLTVSEYSFPKKLGNMMNIELTNAGYGGVSADEWYTAHGTDDFSGNDFAIIQLGVNDAIRYSAWTQTSIDAFSDIVTMLKAQNTSIKIFISTIIPASSYTGATYDLVSQGIRDFVTNLSDDNIILIDLALYGHTKDETAFNAGHLTAYGYLRLAKDYYNYMSYYISQNKDKFSEIQFTGTSYSFY